MKLTTKEVMVVDNSEFHGTSTTGYSLSDMDDDDLRSLLTIINSAGLVERRHWNHIKRELETILRDKQ